ncbi:class I SAM-dependent methyltransferase [bacterium]|nr:class I SAM-dependent methyltransferase [bacterium]
MGCENKGYCICCDQAVTFSSVYDWFRDHYRCQNCNSIPKERALMTCLELFYPHWRDLKIHESSPVWTGASRKIRDGCKDYLPTMYHEGTKCGEVKDGFRCENLEQLTFENEMYDLHITSDVMEHVFFPERAFQEIARTLKPGGVHIFTVPLVMKNKQSRVRAVLDERTKEIQYIEKPDYHGDHLVTRDWGYDIKQFISDSSAMESKIILIENIDLGLKAEYNDVVISVKQ